jgi:endonuclease/exonuclease/phosphatase family metal-dependent hydrolase
MRFLLYNIAYGTGAPQSYAHRAVTLHRYLKSPPHHIQMLHEFVCAQEPDIVGLVEMDTGSFRAGGHNHVTEMARLLSHDYLHCSKYHANSIGRRLPILRHQCNALFANVRLEACEQHYLPHGFKRLVLEARVHGTRIFLVHLALNEHTRRKQLSWLGRLVGLSEEPVILAGDFNTFKGRHELENLKAVTGLKSANRERRATYPSWAPRKELDFILCSPAVNIDRFEVMHPVRLSDHLPLLLEYSLK